MQKQCKEDQNLNKPKDSYRPPKIGQHSGVGEQGGRKNIKSVLDPTNRGNT